MQLIVTAIQPFLVPICFVSAWSIIALVTWSLWTATRDTVTRTREMHRIPCANCQFFTSDYHLKCTVHPSDALTEDAINCPDYQPENMSYRSTRERMYR
nr:hypothetical protein [Leptolyngbya sp. FACHB-36]